MQLFFPVGHACLDESGRSSSVRKNIKIKQILCLARIVSVFDKFLWQKIFFFQKKLFEGLFCLDRG